MKLIRESVEISDDDGDNTNDDDNLMQVKWCAQVPSLKKTQDLQPENTQELCRN